MAVFVDNDTRSLECVRANLEKSRLAARATLRRLAIPGGLPKLAANGQCFDVIYADPPFEFREYSALIEAVFDAALLASGGVLVLEHAKDALIPEESGALRRHRHETYGSVGLSFFS